MEKWKDGRMDKWMDGWMDEWMNGCGRDDQYIYFRTYIDR